MDLRTGQRSLGIGIAASAVAIALVTVAIYALREVMPVAGAGVLYLLPVLIASTGWGLWLGVTAAIALGLTPLVFVMARRWPLSRS